MIADKSVYDLLMHETTKIKDDYFATRVPNGLIYEIYNGDLCSVVFVPFNN